MKRITALDLFARTVKTERGCWEWTGTRKYLRGGYGSICVNYRHHRVHRLAWELVNGPIPNGLHVLHHCDNPPCIKTEPDDKYPSGHLFLGTQAQNMSDMTAKGRRRNGASLGQRHGNAKLRDADIPEIRALVAGGAERKVVAGLFKVHVTTICDIVNGRHWRHVPTARPVRQ